MKNFILFRLHETHDSKRECKRPHSGGCPRSSIIIVIALSALSPLGVRAEAVLVRLRGGGAVDDGVVARVLAGGGCGDAAGLGDGGGGAAEGAAAEDGEVLCFGKESLLRWM